ncbi:MAG: S41 family peptidase [Mariniblastus sp.]
MTFFKSTHFISRVSKLRPRISRLFIGCWIVFIGFVPLLSAQEFFDFDKSEVFDEVSNAVKDHFYDRKFDAGEWQKRSTPFRERALSAKSLDQFDSVVNELLATLNASHTNYFSRRNPKRYQLFGVFNKLYEDDESLFCYDGIGIDTKSVDGRTLIVSIYDGLPAAKSGLRFGDEIVSVDGKPFHPIGSFFQKSGVSTKVELLRVGKRLFIDVEVEKLDGRTMFETALESSVAVIERGEHKIGYLHVWSYAGSQYQEKVRETLLWGKLSKCDSLVFDLRDGWGGADLNYLNLFRPAIAVVESESRTSEPKSYSGVWEKPIAVLTNDRSTSGKELFTFGFKKLKLGKVFGGTTAGAVVAGRIFPLSNGDVLYLASADVRVDGKRLEGVGVAPDVVVERPIESSNVDPQLEAALKYLESK